tara:strand:- start:3109 stop:4476 length:1368 start_codon:yes stop_codon:yes gene_type:complete
MLEEVRNAKSRRVDFRSVLPTAITAAALTLLVRIIFISAVSYYPAADDLKYDHLAFRLANENRYVNESGDAEQYIQFGYPFVLSLAYRIFEHNVLAGRMLNAMLDGTTSIVLVLLCYKFGLDSKQALVSSLLFALHPSQIYYGSVLLPESLSATLVMLVVFALMSNKRFLVSLLVGTLLGGMFLTKYGTPFFLLLALSILVVDVGTGRRLFVHLLMVLLGFVFAFAPYGWMVRRATGNLSDMQLPRGGLVFFLGTVEPWAPIHDGFQRSPGGERDGMTEQERSQLHLNASLNEIIRHPVKQLFRRGLALCNLMNLDVSAYFSAFTAKYGSYDRSAARLFVAEPREFLWFLVPVVSSALFAVALLAGFFVKGFATIKWLIVSWSIPYILTWSEPRYMMAVSPLICIVVSHLNRDNFIALLVRSRVFAILALTLVMHWLYTIYFLYGRFSSKVSFLQ